VREALGGEKVRVLVGLSLIPNLERRLREEEGGGAQQQRGSPGGSLGGT
jgi:hypothetical protein